MKNETTKFSVSSAILVISNRIKHWALIIFPLCFFFISCNGSKKQSAGQEVNEVKLQTEDILFPVSEVLNLKSYYLSSYFHNDSLSLIYGYNYKSHALDCMDLKRHQISQILLSSQGESAVMRSVAGLSIQTPDSIWIYDDTQRILLINGDGKLLKTVDLRQELKDNPSAVSVKIGSLACAYSKEMFEEEGAYYTSHLWITGVDDVAFECSFTVSKGASVAEAEAVIASLEIRKEGVKYPAELIPVRLSEIYQINEAFEWVTTTVKEQLKKDFQGMEEDLDSMQQVIDSGTIGPKKKEAWLSFGIAICVILANEVDGLEWMTLIDGNREAPVLQNLTTGEWIDPMKLVWSKVKAGEPCNLAETYKSLL